MAAHSTLAPYPTIGTAPSWQADDDIFSSDGLPITLWPLPMHPSENAHPHDNLLEASQQYFVESTNTAVDIVHRKREVFDSLLGGVPMPSLEYFGPAQPQDVLFSTPNANSDHRFANAAPGCSMVTPPEKPCWQQVAFTNHLKTHQQISQQQRHAHAMPPAMHANSSMNNLSPSVSRPQVTEKAAKPKTKMMPPPPPPPPPPPRTKQSKQNIKEPSTPPNDTDMLPLIPDGTNTSEVLTCPPTKIAKPVLQPPVSPAGHSGRAASATTDTDTDTTLLVASILANSQSKKRASAARPTGRPATRSTPRKVAVKKVQGQKESPSKNGKKKMAHLPVERKAKKACREKNRRRSMNNAFQELSVLVGQQFGISLGTVDGQLNVAVRIEEGVYREMTDYKCPVTAGKLSFVSSRYDGSSMYMNVDGYDCQFKHFTQAPFSEMALFPEESTSGIAIGRELAAEMVTGAPEDKRIFQGKIYAVSMKSSAAFSVSDAHCLPSEICLSG